MDDEDFLASPPAASTRFRGRQASSLSPDLRLAVITLSIRQPPTGARSSIVRYRSPLIRSCARGAQGHSERRSIDPHKWARVWSISPMISIAPRSHDDDGALAWLAGFLQQFLSGAARELRVCEIGAFGPKRDRSMSQGLHLRVHPLKRHGHVCAIDLTSGRRLASTENGRGSSSARSLEPRMNDSTVPEWAAEIGLRLVASIFGTNGEPAAKERDAAD